MKFIIGVLVVVAAAVLAVAAGCWVWNQGVRDCAAALLANKPVNTVTAAWGVIQCSLAVAAATAVFWFGVAVAGALTGAGSLGVGRLRRIGR